MHRINKLSLLLVDDNTDLVQYWSAQLERHFDSIVLAGHAFEALEVLHRQLPDAAFIDVDLPEMDGYQLCKEIKSNPKFRNLPVILNTSGYLKLEDKRLATKSGAERIILKPATIDEIVRIVEETYTESQVRQVVNAETRELEPTDSQGGYADFLTRQLGETINQLKKEQKALNLALDRFRDFAYHAGEYFWETDSQMKLRFVGGSSSNALALPLKNYEGRGFFEYFENYFHADWLASLCANFETEAAFEKNGSLMGAGSPKTVRIVAHPYTLRDQQFSGFRGIITDITDSKRTSEELYYAAHHDALTELLNAQAFKDTLQKELNQFTAGDEHVLCYLDLDFFKEVNDTAGHRAGDELLVQLAELFRGKVRANDVLGRIGGDEFAILLRHCNIDQARRLVQELHNSIKTFRFFWESQCFEIGLSIGLLEITSSTLSVAETMDLADQACYAAKNSGRNQIRVFGDGSQEGKLAGDALWIEKFHKAINADTLCLFQQPIRRVQSHAGANGFEVLVRMRDGEKLVKPEEFLSVIERYQLSIILDRWVVNKLVDFLENEEWSSDFTGDFYSVNVTTASLCDPEFRLHVYSRLINQPLVASRLCFEVTESSAMENLSQAMEFMRTMRKLGCRFALDDFGTGFSSLAHLKNLPVDYVKLDGVFVQGIDTDPVDWGFVESIQRLAALMHIETIAEYVENESTANRLSEIGVDYLQGYYIGYPEIMEHQHYSAEVVPALTL